MTRSERLFARAKKLIPGGVNSPVRAFSPYPFFTKSAKGSKLTDVDGVEFVDYCLGYGPLILGHADERVMGAVREQLGRGSLFGTPSEGEVELAELICKLVPSAEMVRLVSTGGEATMSAIRLARGFTGRKKVLKFEGCYHGAHDCVLVKAGSGLLTFGMPDSLGVPEETAGNTVVVPFNDVAAFEAMVKRERRELAAVIVEPVIGNIGVVLPKEGFLEALREITEQYGVVLVFDEVITGFRLALGGAQEFYGVKPDLTTLGKILGGGFPLAAFAGREDIMRMIAPSGKVYQAGTFSGNPVSVAAGLAVLRTLRARRSFYSMMEKKCEGLVKQLRQVANDARVQVQVNSVGSMFQMFLSEEPVFDYASAKKSDSKRFMQFHHALLQHGVFIPPSQFETCFLSAAHSDGDLKMTIEAYKQALESI
ncbi:MAG: glutamate-1-semialdehyde 2,1-aminomutase [Candidatus Bathyarchaeia archaeon]